MNTNEPTTPSDAPTPETSEAAFGTGRVSVDFARRLEHERDEARAQLAAAHMNLGTKIIEAVVRSGAIEKAIILENGNQILVWRSNASEQIEAALAEIDNEQTPTPMNDRPPTN